ncbi:MAG: monofunctional biosynthetic peptidoglycan transglycosylase [Calditrichaeota bacterium]|nr:transglycosylase domain-containing protein [Calditrichota bacterium]RQW08154.1 MAG: monofunctional biosynthetic peptidoglycan transglycosylase [Calditrichota bacterium]
MKFFKAKSFWRFWFFYVLSFIFLILFYFLYLYLTLPDVSLLATKTPEKTALMKYRQQDKNYVKHRNNIIYHNIQYSQIPDLMRKTIIVAEDASFWIHEGIDWFEVRESIKKNINEGQFTRGGSTITQQLARNLYLNPRKDISRKIEEWLIARELEKEIKKSRILELYLNVVEWGYNVFGIGAASSIYFQRPPSELYLDEMVRLAAVLPNPLEMNPTRVNDSVLWRSKIILKRLFQYEFITEEQYRFNSELLQFLYENQ